MNKIKFSKIDQKVFFKQLNTRVHQLLSDRNLVMRAKKILWLKFGFYSILFLSFYGLLLWGQWDNIYATVLNYVLFGLSGILLAFNAAHDAAHGTFAKSKWVNTLIFRFTFNINGVNGYLWKKRHVASHHLFPNVDGCDADIDENAFLRLSPTHRKRRVHKFQHVYATLLYMAYTLHWILFKDFNYLFKKNFSNLRDIRHPKIEVVRLFLWKMIYFVFFLIIPFLAGYSFSNLIIAFLVMHLMISLFFVWTLIISHLTMETAFPVQNERGELPFHYYEHQLATSMDYRPRSVVMNWFLGGFNAHAAHHLFPKFPHTLNRHITFVIQRVAAEHGMPYHSKTFFGALRSHYAYLKVMGVS